jgi:SWI/SNF related-matrix-associated actin-dependent regulator of chromatin subfamily C
VCFCLTAFFPALPRFTVTEVRTEDVVDEEVSPEDGTIRTTTYTRTVSKNRVIVRQHDDAIERIRGGGLDDETTSKPSVTVQPSPIQVESSLHSIPGVYPSSSVLSTDVAVSIHPEPIESRPSPMEIDCESKPAPTSKQQLDSAVIEIGAPTTLLESSENLAVPQTTTSCSEKIPEPQVIPLAKRPLNQWEEHTVCPNNEVDNNAKIKLQPDWYKPTAVSSLERAVLSEWFDGSSTHRTLASYVSAREKMIEMSNKIGQDHFLTGTMVRRTIAGDVGSLLQLHAFLTSYSLINNNAINESTPTPMFLLKRPLNWTDEMMQTNLMHAVVEQTRKRPKVMSTSDFVPIDWEAVATSVGCGATSSDCERQFLTMPISNVTNDGSVTPDVSDTSKTITLDQSKAQTIESDIQHKFLTNLVNSVDPAVITAVTKTALSCTEDLQQAQQAGVFGLIAHKAADEVRLNENNIARIIAEILDVRMKKLENRVSYLDDVEGMLEAERVALELERRDLYTARCRHWFGGT